MTAAFKSGQRSPITVARGGGGKEGFSSSVKTSFSSRNAFTPKESAPKFMSTGPKNPLHREISIGRPMAPKTPFATNFSHGERSTPMVHIDYKSGLLRKKTPKVSTPEAVSFKNTKPLIVAREPATDRTIAKPEAVKAFKSKEYITLFDRSKMNGTPEKKAPPIIGAPNHGVEKPASVISPRTALLKERAALAATSIITARPQVSEVKPTIQIHKQPTVQAEKPQQIHKAITPEKTGHEIVKPFIQPRPAMSEIAIHIVKNKEATPAKQVSTPQLKAAEQITLQRNKSHLNEEKSLTQVREAIKQVTKPVVHSETRTPLARQPEITLQKPHSPFSERTQKTDTRKAAPVDILKRRDMQKISQTLKPTVAVSQSKLQEIERSIAEPKELDKAKEQTLLTRYISDYVLPKITEPNGQRMQKELAHKMAIRIKTKSLMDPGSQIEAQLLGDANSNSEQVMLKKIEDLVSETRVTVQLAKITGTEPELAEKKALVSLHRKIQESGMTDMFDKVKTTLMADLMKDATQMPDVKTATKAEEELPNNKMKTDEEEEERHNRTQGSFQSVEIERDPIADRARREFLRNAAEHAFIEAESKGEHEIHGADIVHAAGNPQKTEIKSEPVRYDALPDYSITETMIDIERTSKPITSIEQANDIIRREVDDKAPVRLRKRPTQEIRYWTDLVRVFGHLLTPAEMHPKAA